MRISTDGWNDICRHRLLEAGCSTATRVDFLPLKFILPNWHQRFTSCHKRFAIVLFLVIILKKRFPASTDLAALGECAALAAKPTARSRRGDTVGQWTEHMRVFEVEGGQ